MNKTEALNFAIEILNQINFGLKKESKKIDEMSEENLLRALMEAQEPDQDEISDEMSEENLLRALMEAQEPDQDET